MINTFWQNIGFVFRCVWLSVLMAVAGGVGARSSERGVNSVEHSVTDSEGVLPGIFSVSGKMKVRFSKGNLQYYPLTRTWRFALNQWDLVGIGDDVDVVNDNYVVGNVAGSDNREIADDYDGWIDLFGWGTGGKPACQSTFYSDYSVFTDWGVNAISNGGDEKGEEYRTLSYDEWFYLLSRRKKANEKFAVAMVCGVNGVVLLPDIWMQPEGVDFRSGTAYQDDWRHFLIVNNYDADEWKKMEDAGAVFLPAAGYRRGKSVMGVGKTCFCWTSDAYDIDDMFCFFAIANGVYVDYGYCANGLSVRLVKECESSKFLKKKK